MNKAEFQRAFKIAEQRAETGVDFDWSALEVLAGCGTFEVKKVSCTVEAVAELIRYQARCLDGSWDHQEINSLADIARRKFTVIN